MEMGEFLIFSCFWIKPIIVGHFSGAMIVLEGDVGLEKVAGGVGEEKTAKNGENSLVVAFVVVIFEFFPFLRSVGDRDMATNVVGFIWVLQLSYVVVIL